MSIVSKNNLISGIFSLCFLFFIFLFNDSKSAISATTTASSTDTFHIEDRIIPQPRVIKAVKIDKERPSSEVISGDFKIHTDNRVGYIVKYPREWKSYEIPSMDYTRFENINDKDYFKIEVVKLPRNSLSLEKWVEGQNSLFPNPRVLEIDSLKISGKNTIYQLEQFNSHISPAFFIENGDYVYIIKPSSNDDKFKNSINDFITNFSFK